MGHRCPSTHTGNPTVARTSQAPSTSWRMLSTPRQAPTYCSTVGASSCVGPPAILRWEKSRKQLARLDAYLESLEATRRCIDAYLAPTELKERLKRDLRQLLARRSSKPTPHASGENQFDVFLSYSHDDASCVEQLACVLEDIHKFRVWLDKWILPPGKLWQQEIFRALTQTAACVICIGSSTPKGWFLQEIHRALNIQSKDENFSVIPVILPGGHENMIDDFLELHTWVDLSSGLKSEEAMHLLICGIKKIAPGRFVSARAESAKMTVTPVITRLKELAELREQKIIDEDVHKRFQINMLEDYLQIEGVGDVKL